MKHVETIIGDERDSREKSLFTRAMGKFYTPAFIAERLSSNLISQINFTHLNEFSLIDPFCGDGRLIVSFLRHAVRNSDCKSLQWHITLWDYDAEAVMSAKQNIEAEVTLLGLDASVNSVCQDSFLISKEEYGQYHCVITNPPWDTLKPDSREMVSMPSDQKVMYRNALKAYDRQLADILPNSQPTRKYGGWGTNLSRSGVELALKLTKRGYFCGIVTPMTLLSDQISSRLRHWIFAEAEPYTLDYYPAESKLFDGVDQETISICFRKLQSKSNKLKCQIIAFDRNKKIMTCTDLKASYEMLQSMDYCLPVKHGDIALSLFYKWREFPNLEDLEMIDNRRVWIGRELDETGYNEYIVEQGRYKFLKGRMIGRYGITEHPTSFVSEELRRIPDTVSYFRIVWRDVSRRSQARRMQATIIPPDIVTGNSLNVLHIGDNDLQRLQILLAIINSIPFEFQVRSRLGTGHISASIVRKIRIPDLNSSPYLSRISEYFDGLTLKSSELEQDLEILVARAYGLTRIEYHTLLDSLEGLTSDYKSDLLAYWDAFN